jgi:hypothetical protein
MPSISPLDPLILISPSMAVAQRLHRKGVVAAQQGARLHGHAGVVLARRRQRAPRQKLGPVDLGAISAIEAGTGTCWAMLSWV